MVKPYFEKAVIIGVGLIGSSLALALREHGVVNTIDGCDTNPDVLNKLHSLGITDGTHSTIEKACPGADLIIVSTPVGAAKSLILSVANHADDNAIIIDVGSVKGSFLKAAATLGDRVHIIPCHPVAGTEKSGPEAGFSSLFKGRWCILTPLNKPNTAYQAAIEKTSALWQAIGSNIEIMDADHHDLALAVTSHLPHLIAFTLIGAADDLETIAEAEIIKYSAGGFRDFTRIAASDPTMWRDVFINNKDAVLEVLGRFTEELTMLQRAIRWGDEKTLEEVFSRGRALRRAIVDAGQETDTTNFGRDDKS